DGTPRNTCSATNTTYCSSTSTIIPLQTNCASQDGVAHTADDCGFCGANTGTFCRTDGACASPTGGRGLLGDYYQGGNFETLVNADVLDPVIDFGPHFGLNRPYFNTLLARTDRANTAGLASVRWDGYLNIPTDQPITYYLGCYKQCKLYLDNLTTPSLSVNLFSGVTTVTLTPGWHRIRVDYQRDALNTEPGLQLGWKLPSSACTLPIGGTFPLSLACVIPNDALAPSISGGRSGIQQVAP
ncbi:MAG: hypothetical protein HYZ09_04070, partial [Candidatus Kerfeldbacteria bacterium]|nr:hypothetical protein [Candidatus Kerfeldbacteria bacterium]